MSASHHSHGQTATNDRAKPSVKQFLKTWLRLFREDLPWNKEQYYVRRHKKEVRARRKAKRRERRAARDAHVTIQTVSGAHAENQSMITFEESSLRDPKEERIEEIKDELDKDENESIV